MKYLERFLRYIFWVVVTASIAWIVKKAFQRAAEAQRPGAVRGRVEPSVTAAKAKALFRDPVCGTYVAEDISYLLEQGKETLHFCSRDCMEHYQRDLRSEDDRAANRLAAGA
jgi:YHS domain-containing protein